MKLTPPTISPWPEDRKAAGFTVDGFSATPAAPFEQRLWTMVNSPSVDAIQEFAVDTDGFKAEFGHARQWILCVRIEVRYESVSRQSL